MLLKIVFFTTVISVTLAGYGTPPKGDPCLVAPDPGPCRGSCPRFYFDSDDNTCKKFIYGCCGGNRNNYRTQKQCLDSCNDGCPNGVDPNSVRCIVGACTIQTCPGFPRAKCIARCNGCFSQFVYKGRDVTNKCNSKKSIKEKGSCSAAPDPGPCDAHCPRFYFDPSGNRCKEFIYGCCKGNSNNYRTQEQCLDSCNDGCPDGTNPKEIRCIVGACTFQTCRNFPGARCVPRCNSCISQFIYKGRDVTSQCNAA